jgi:hypothetical protein
MKKPSKKCLSNKADKLWREMVIETYGERCTICGKTGVNIHHIVGRANRSTRWYVPNGVPLCAGCHTFKSLSAHQHPLWFRNEMVLLRGVEWEKDLIKKSNEIWNKQYEVKE